ncbi:MAG: hypothetical protein FJW30_15730 [Acidobacteria bacterium]|nr:hypothetical protein [Acidobacteriota bacterium]
MKRRLFVTLPFAAVAADAQQKIDDPILEVMAAELARSMQLRLAGEMPYFIEYSLEDGVNFSCMATLGGLISTNVSPYKIPRTVVRVGSYEFDNSNAVFTGQVRGPRFDQGRWPLEFNRSQIQGELWLATDRAYKAAVQELSLKKSALQNVTQSEKLNDFAKQEKVVKLMSPAKPAPDEKKWNDVARRLSAVFSAYPKILDTRVEIDDSSSTAYLANSEGTLIRMPETVVAVRARAEALAADGAVIRNHRFFHAFRFADLPPEETMRAELEGMAKQLTALAEAPLAEAYTGPVLFESFAAAQLIAQIIGTQLHVMRDPVSVPGRPVNLPAGELEGRLGARVMPDSFDVVDDPNAQWKGRPLFGNTEADFQGVVPKRTAIIEKGTLKSLLHSRQPVRGHEGSTGHGRLPGPFGHAAANPTNLIVTSSETTSRDALKKKLLDTVAQRRKPFGVIVRRLDYPSSASVVELRRMANAMQGSGAARPFSLPLEIVRVYPDGREEPMRGVRFRGMNVRLLRDIVGAGDDAAPMEFLLNTSPLALMGAGGYIVGASVVCPSLLFDEVEIERPSEERPRPPVVPPPPLSSGV